MKGNSNRGQVNSKMVVVLVLAISVAAIMAAFVLPIAVSEVEAPANTTANQTVGEDVELTGQLNSTLTGVTAGTPDTATYNVTIYDNSSARESAIVTVDESDTSTSTVTLDGNDVVINATDIETDGGSDNWSVAEYQYPRDAGWGSGASSLWGLLGLAMVLVVFLYVVGLAVSAGDRI